jgi:hypothetical protein
MFEYYYNNVPDKGLCRNNLVYTSLIDRKNNFFKIRYKTDQLYHNGECLSQHVLDKKWKKELVFSVYNNTCLEIESIDIQKQEIVFYIEGDDFWQQANCNVENYSKVVPDWEEQMLDILQSIRSQGFWKFSLHPSSYFIIEGKLRTINHFFCYQDNEPNIPTTEVLDHISEDRKNKLFNYYKENNIDIHTKLPYTEYAKICLESFRANYTDSFIDKAKEIYV